MTLTRTVTLAVRVDEQINTAVVAAAISKHERPSEWLRGAILAALLKDGLLPRAEPQQQFARVVDGEIVNGPSFIRDERDGWLPIENEDSEPFDPSRHWRLKPLPLRVESNRVVRTYPVVAKSLEHA